MAERDQLVSRRRLAALQESLCGAGTEAAVLTPGPDLRWLIGYVTDMEDDTAIMLVPAGGRPRLVINASDRDHFAPQPEAFEVALWSDAESYYAGLRGPIDVATKGTVHVGASSSAANLLYFQRVWREAEWAELTPLVAPLRRRKDADEIDALRRAAVATDRVIHDLQGGIIPLRRRTEREVATDVKRGLLANGIETIGFCMVSHGANAANEHHQPDDTVLGDGVLLVDIGGTMDGYYSDTTRCLHLGEPPDDVVMAYRALRRAQEAGVMAVGPGVAAADVDRRCRGVLTEAAIEGIGPCPFGHGLGLQMHEPPMLHESSDEILVSGEVVTVEPHLARPGQWGLRIEDAVLVTADGRERLNRTSRELIIVP